MKKLIILLSTLILNLAKMDIIMVIENDFEGSYEDIDIKKDVELVKQIRDTLKHK